MGLIGMTSSYLVKDGDIYFRFRLTGVGGLVAGAKHGIHDMFPGQPDAWPWWRTQILVASGKHICQKTI